MLTFVPGLKTILIFGLVLSPDKCDTVSKPSDFAAQIMLSRKQPKLRHSSLESGSPTLSRLEGSWVIK
jgi:hypothetical protein